MHRSYSTQLPVTVNINIRKGYTFLQASLYIFHHLLRPWNFMSLASKWDQVKKIGVIEHAAKLFFL